MTRAYSLAYLNSHRCTPPEAIRVAAATGYSFVGLRLWPNAPGAPQQHLLGNPQVRNVFLAHHAELLEPEFWQRRQERIRAGLLEDVFPYPDALRFRHRKSSHGAGPSPSNTQIRSLS